MDQHTTTSRCPSLVRLALLALLLGPLLTACGGNLGASVKRGAFTSSEYGVAVSPRVTSNPNPPKGGGRYLVGNPYKVRGKTYTPSEQPDYVAQGEASWYGSDFHGRRTANGEIFSANAITGAHATLPIPSYVRVTNLENGRSIIVRINDRGPYVHGRIIDLSHRAAELLGYINRGMTNVQVDYISPAPLEGDDTRFLLASLNRSTVLEDGQGSTRLAMTDPQTPVVLRGSNTRDPVSLADIATGLFDDIFSYADTSAEAQNREILSAHDAVTAMATRSDALDDWVASVDEDARAIRLELGTFTDPRSAIDTAIAFALLGAVDEDAVTAGAIAATRLTLTHLKPGVSRIDVLDLARQLGLDDIKLY